MGRGTCASMPGTLCLRGANRSAGRRRDVEERGGVEQLQRTLNSRLAPLWNDAPFHRLRLIDKLSVVMLSSRVLVVAAVSLVALVALTAVSASSPPLRITQLPGYSEQITDEMYTGYVDVEDSYNSQIFYWVRAKTASDATSSGP